MTFIERTSAGLSRNKGLFVKVAITVMLVAISGHNSGVKALPTYEYDYFYYDLSEQLVAEEYRLCSGGHWIDGNPTLAQPGYFDVYRYACGNQIPPYEHCWGSIDSSGVKHIDGCEV